MSDANSPVATIARAKPRNILKGITPIADTWDTAPINLSNCANGDLSTPCGDGSKVMSASGVYGELVFDLGSVKTVMLTGRFSLWNSVGASITSFIYIDGNDSSALAGDPNWRNSSNPLLSVGTATAHVMKEAFMPVILTARYIRLRFYVNGACTASANVYEVIGYELGV